MRFDLTTVLIQWTILLFSLCLHELGHAWSAYLCGDDTAKHHGRITMNPVAHADLVGTVILPLAMMTFGGGFFGWAKPVPVNPARLRQYPRDEIIVSLAGIFMNLSLATCGIVILRVCNVVDPSGASIPIGVRHLAWYLVATNIVLAVFNLMPVPPLDGFHVIKHFLPFQWRLRNEKKIFQYGPILLLLLVFTGAYSIVLTPALIVARWLASI